MVGEGVLHECLNSPLISEVLIVNRRKSTFSNPKLKEIVHANFKDITAIQDQLKGYDACFFCLGVSSVGMDKQTYFDITYTLTLNFAEILSKQNPQMTFCYVSGAGTDSTEKGRLAWARVKGKVENDLQKLPFKAVYNFRPGMLEPTKGLQNTISLYRYVGWLTPVFRKLFPNSISTLQQLGIAMISVVAHGFDKSILEVPDIKMAAGKLSPWKELT
ncbi:MAG: hypothetical protein RIQ47_1936 [Bacteroidota bacterium]